MQWFHLFQYLLTILDYLSHLREISVNQG